MSILGLGGITRAFEAGDLNFGANWEPEFESRFVRLESRGRSGSWTPLSVKVNLEDSSSFPINGVGVLPDRQS
jgi:hypothetical protein